MALVDLVMPKLGESIMEATILKWHKQPGDHVNMDETVLEIATDKVDSEVPSTYEGVIEEILFKVNDVVPVGTVIAKIKTGDTVVDLGSGAGNDAFIARRIVGERGRVIGIDITEKMIELAKNNVAKLGYTNVEFRHGDIDSMPLVSNKADVVVSNCVLNLVPNKHKVFGEIFRVLKPGGHFSISDIVIEGELPLKWKEIAELYAGCVSGAIQKSEYLGIIEEAGFTNITLQKDKTIVIPDEILAEYLSDEEIDEYKNSNVRITSITVYADKPSKDERNCCEPGSGCC